MPSTANAAQPPALRLKRDEDRRLRAGHLWVFSNEVDTDQTPLSRFEPGDLVRVLAHHDRPISLAHVNPRSLICARLLETWTAPDVGWFAGRLRRALALRERLYEGPYYRLIHGEADGLPGLIVDRFGPACVVQIGTAGMERARAQIQAALFEAIGIDTVLYKNDGGAREFEGLPLYVEAAGAPFPDVSTVVERGLEFHVPLREGQKTGWYYDQAANRDALVKYVRRGARVLDVFSYVGAWGVRAAHAGAADVLCVDGSARALEFAEQNAKCNGLSLRSRKGDAFDVLASLATEGERFDVVILDPPAFAKRKKDLPKAQAAYRRLNQAAIRLLAPDGVLVSCSCSHHLGAGQLQDAIAKAARGCGRRVQVLETGGQGADHPVHPAIAETRYLKAFFCRIDAAFG
ncbi:MAG TPA: class I SAM-dependent rRNA methyltransferase [Steroidobacteraceae bacterium]|nr:class I SAM-dependent rRNA methyltransferase [Steroidobacteraceae bacterium]